MRKKVLSIVLSLVLVSGIVVFLSIGSPAMAAPTDCDVKTWINPNDHCIAHTWCIDTGSSCQCGHGFTSTNICNGQ